MWVAEWCVHVNQISFILLKCCQYYKGSVGDRKTMSPLWDSSSAPFFQHLFAYTAISHRNHGAKKRSNLSVCKIHGNAICAAYSKIMMKQKVITRYHRCVCVCFLLACLRVRACACSDHVFVRARLHTTGEA